MSLFSFDSQQNLLPYDGVVNYYGNVLEPQLITRYYNDLLHQIPWEQDVIYMFGKKIITQRKVAWYGDNPYVYTYSKSSKTALPWTAVLSEIKLMVEQQTKETYNSCLLNLYHDGSEGMSWHSDDEKELEQNGAICALSLGDDRRFSFKHKDSKEKVNLTLETGSLLLMKGTVQKHWLHCLPKTKKMKNPRISLTFRTIV